METGYRICDCARPLQLVWRGTRNQSGRDADQFSQKNFFEITELQNIF